MRKREERMPSKQALDACKCEACKRAKGQPHKIAFGRVHDYSASPIGGWRVHTTFSSDPNEYALGVELETQAPPGVYDEEDEDFDGDEDETTHCRMHGWEYDLSATDTSYWSRWDREQLAYHNDNCAAPYEVPETPGVVHIPPVSTKEAADMARPKEFWLPKHDGSVTGPEFASHPATLAWWYEHRSDLTEMFTMLLHSGYRSHEGDTAGMHVNISTSAFGSKKVITPPSEPFTETKPHSDREIVRLEVSRSEAYTVWNEAAEEYATIHNREFPEPLAFFSTFTWLDINDNPVGVNDETAHHVGVSPASALTAVPAEPSEEHERLRIREDTYRTLWYEASGQYDDARGENQAWVYRREHYQGRVDIEVYEGAEEHLRRFVDLVYVNKQWSRRMSQRSVNSLHWCKLDLLDDDYRRDRWVKRAIREGYSNDDRYLAVNRPDEHRFEFRLPRGTLRLDRFYKNLEWTHSMIEYTRIADATDCTPPKYMAWVLRNEAYPYLRSYIEEHFPSQIANQKLKVMK